MLLCIILTTTVRSGGCEEQSEFQNSYRHIIFKNLKKTLILLYYPSPPKLSLHQCCTQNGKRGSKDLYWPLDFANITSVSSTRFVSVICFQWRLKFLRQLTSQKENESNWKSFQRKTALNKKKERETRHVWTKVTLYLIFQRKVTRPPS